MPRANVLASEQPPYLPAPRLDRDGADLFPDLDVRWLQKQLLDVAGARTAPESPERLFRLSQLNALLRLRLWHKSVVAWTRLSTIS